MAVNSLDQGTRDYLEERFNNIDDKMEQFIKSQEKTDSKIDNIQSQISSNVTEISLLKTFKHEHIDMHNNTHNNKKYSVEMILIALFFAANFIRSFFPAP